MPCAESLCCGTPVVGFEAGAPEQIALKDYSEFVPFGDLDQMETVLRKWLGREDLNRQQIAQTACDTYSSGNMVRVLQEMYGRI